MIVSYLYVLKHALRQSPVLQGGEKAVADDDVGHQKVHVSVQGVYMRLHGGCHGLKILAVVTEVFLLCTDYC